MEKSSISVENVPEGWNKIVLNGDLEKKIGELNKRTNKVVCLVCNIENVTEKYVGVLDRVGNSPKGVLYQIKDSYDGVDFEYIEVEDIKEIYTDFD